MIVEFVGSTGAGKTTIASQVQRRLAQSAQVVSAYDLAADLLGLGHTTNPTLRNLTQDLVGLPFFFRALVRHRAFAAFALKTIARRCGWSLMSLNYVRSIVRKLGTYELSKQYGRDRIVLVDEGTVSSAHLLFVFTRSLYCEEEVKAFAALVPLPELVVYVKAPAGVLVQRSLQRSDVRRELRSKERKAVEAYVGRAVEVFDRLTETERIRDRVLVVSNPTATEAEIGTTAERIARFILEDKPAGSSALTRPTGKLEPEATIGEMGVS